MGERVWTGLDPVAADGLACVVCATIGSPRSVFPNGAPLNTSTRPSSSSG